MNNFQYNTYKVSIQVFRFFSLASYSVSLKSHIKCHSCASVNPAFASALDSFCVFQFFFLLFRVSNILLILSNAFDLLCFCFSLEHLPAYSLFFCRLAVLQTCKLETCSLQLAFLGVDTYYFTIFPPSSYIKLAIKRS